MICDARELPNRLCLEADIAIVGAGPAGITLALELMGAGLSVLLLEAGGEKPGRSAPDSFDGAVVDSTRHPPANLYRSRGLGGTSAVWGGRCVPFDPIDLEERPHIPHSGWPITYEELSRWYPRALKICEAGSFRFSTAEALPPEAPPMIPGHADGDGRIRQDQLERFSPPTRFGRRYARELARSSEITVLVNAACTALTPETSRRAVKEIHCATRAGHSFSVRAKRIILAAGALETARLMLSSRLGNDLVGRFYMTHVEGKAATARFRPGAKVVFGYERDSGGIYLRRHFSITPETQRQQRLTNVILRFEPPLIADPTHGDPVLSAMWLSRTFFKPEYERKLASFGYRGAEDSNHASLAAQHLRNVAKGAPALARFAMDWAWRHVLPRRKLPYVAVAGRDNAFTLDYNGEQIPNPDSRVFLDERVDGLGLPRLVIDWRTSPQDIEGVLAAHRLLARFLSQDGTGALEIDEESIRHGANAVGGHHMGTTRMADDPAHGVVDRQSRVFGVDNLFVTGAAVFPTSSHANPTLTLVALASRLAEHLRGA